MVNVWFDGWEPIVRIVVVGSASYLALVLLLRTSGKRTIAQMDIFDFVVIVAVGSTLGRVMTARSVPIAEAVVAFAVLVAWQWVVSGAQVRWRWARDVLTSDPELLVRDGRVLERALRRQRINREQLDAALRKRGLGSLEEVAAMVLEADGSISVVARGSLGIGDAMPDREDG